MIASATPTRTRLPRRGLTLFLAVSFALAWLVFLLVALSGGPGNPIAGPLLALAMWAPAAGTFAAWAWGGPPRPVLGTRRRGPWRWYPVAWLGAPLIVALGAVLVVVTGVQRADTSLSNVRAMAEAIGQPFIALPFELAVLFSIGPVLSGALFNGLVAFGEEVGWRGYLLGALLPLGARRAALAVGAIWGLWHWPLIVQGWNYPGEPLLGPLCMVMLCLVWGVILAWLRLKSGSIWPAALGHGAFNAAGLSLPVFFLPASPLLGVPAGLVVLLPAALVALWLLRSPLWDQVTPHPEPAGDGELSRADS